MEMILTGGLGFLGNEINKRNKYNYNNINPLDELHKDLKNNPNVSLYSNEIKLKKNELGFNQDVYYANISENINNIIKNKSAITREESNDPINTNVVPQQYNNLKNFDPIIKANQIMEQSSLKNERNNQSYADQFNLERYENIKRPDPANKFYSNESDRILNIQKGLAESGGFTIFEDDLDMTYKITPTDQFTHNNMQPYTSQRDRIVNNYNCDNNQIILDRYTGSSKLYVPKKEVEPFFQPKDSINIPYDPNETADIQKDRYIKSRYKQNEKPFDPIKVNVGLDLPYDEHSNIGVFDPYRPKYPTIDDMRVKSKQQKSYEGIPISGKKGEKRSIMAPSTKYKPDTAVENKTC